ncbi:hypothetical protein [Pectobacterium colocasium]
MSPAIARDSRHHQTSSFPLSGALGDKGTKNFWQCFTQHEAEQSAQHR